MPRAIKSSALGGNGRRKTEAITDAALAEHHLRRIDHHPIADPRPPRYRAQVAAPPSIDFTPTLLDGISEGYVRLTRHGMVETCNAAAAAMLNVPRAWLPGK